MKYSALLLLIGILVLTQNCQSPMTNTNQSGTQADETAAKKHKVEVPEWARNAVIYELNIRQFTPEGSFSAIEQHLPRLKEMGIDIIWLMPIHPISKTERKGSLGSYYAVNGFREVNPEFGTPEDLENLISAIHEQGMYVLLDWVPHHTGWDHPWIKEHPEWFSKDEEGNIIDPINEEEGEPWGWTDVAEIDLSNQDMRREIISDMIYWLEDVGIDGFRVDHAHGLPDDYWNQVSDSLAQLQRPVFMLAEGEEPRLRNEENFVMTYAWHFHHGMNDIAKGVKGVNYLDSILTTDSVYTFGYHMYFTSNHDENSWAGTVFERMGDGAKAFAVLCHTIDGMPLIYSGQEEPMRKRLKFFDKDTIGFKEYSYAGFYKQLNTLKKNNRALWNGQYGGKAVRINASDYVYAFKREKDDDQVFVILNLSDKQRSTKLIVDMPEMQELFSGASRSIAAGDEIVLEPWEYLVYSNR